MTGLEGEAMRSIVVCAALTTGWFCSGSTVLGQPPERPTLENLLRDDERPKAVDTSSVKPNPQFAYPSGTLQRPMNGSKDPDLDKAWAAYDAAIKNATALLRQKIDQKFVAARIANDAGEANHFSRILDDLQQKGKLPIGEESLKDDAAATSKNYDNAFTELQSAYKAVEKKIVDGHVKRYFGGKCRSQGAIANVRAARQWQAANPERCN